MIKNNKLNLGKNFNKTKLYNKNHINILISKNWTLDQYINNYKTLGKIVENMNRNKKTFYTPGNLINDLERNYIELKNETDKDNLHY